MRRHSSVGAAGGATAMQRAESPPPPNRRHSLLRFADVDRIDACLEPGFCEPAVRFTIKGRETAILLDGALIHHCFVANAENYVHSPIRQRIMRPVFGDAMVVIDGDKWKRARKSTAPMFTPERLAGYPGAMHAICTREFDAYGWTAAPLRLSDLFTRIAFEAMSATLFSGAFSDGRDDFLADISEARAAYGTNEALTQGTVALWLPEMPALRDIAAVARCRARIERVIDRRLDAHCRGRADETNDLLDALVINADPGLDAAALRTYLVNNVMGFVMAGHETSASAQSWMAYLLSQSPDVLARARREADALHAGSVPPERWHEAAPYLRACVDETLRLYPPVPVIPRKAVGPDRFGATTIAGGSLVMIVPGLLHRLHRYWETPDLFDPERFFGARRAGQARFSHLPFGIGPKTCMGQGMAVREIVIVLAEFIRRFDFAYVGNGPPRPRMRVTSTPDNGVPMRVRPRIGS